MVTLIKQVELTGTRWDFKRLTYGIYTFFKLMYNFSYVMFDIFIELRFPLFRTIILDVCFRVF